ncbi:MAG: DUF3127 domain-containing protein [Candidatus Doudnabacteria bacterium]
MALELTGLVIEKLKLEEGISKAGKPWTKQEFIIETEETQYPKKVAFSLMGDKTDLISRIDNGERVKVKFSIESRPFGEKWYSNINAFAVDVVLDDARGESDISALTKKSTNNQADSDDGGIDNLPF